MGPRHFISSVWAPLMARCKKLLKSVRNWWNSHSSAVHISVWHVFDIFVELAGFQVIFRFWFWHSLPAVNLDTFAEKMMKDTGNDRCSRRVPALRLNWENCGRFVSKATFHHPRVSYTLHSRSTWAIQSTRLCLAKNGCLRQGQLRPTAGGQAPTGRLLVGDALLVAMMVCNWGESSDQEVT